VLIDSVPAGAQRIPRIGRTDLARAKYDEGGIFVAGRGAELEALRAMGAREPSLGRLYEGHFNGALLAALYGTQAQRERAHADAEAGHLFGVWNTQDDDPVRIEQIRGRFRLSGAKTWASGADTVTRALITARAADESVVMCLVPLDRVAVLVDPSAWRPLGMEDSNSYRVSFDGVELDTDDVIGRPGDYERAPWFLGGALRFVAVHAGIVERLTGETLAFLAARGRASDPYQIARAGQMRVASRTAWQWVEAGAVAWRAYDAAPSPETADRVVDTVDMARVATERAALDVLELATRSVGAHGLVEPLPFARLLRDLAMYLRQPAPDAVLARVGATGLRAASEARNLAIADSTGSSG
jgi:alkylation response protein AidB-like acyl-CoA dehydrogenase